MKKNIQQSPNKARRLVLFCVVLHNQMRKHFPDLQEINMDGSGDNHGNFQSGIWRQFAGDVWNVEVKNHRRTNARVKELRDNMADYLVNDQRCHPLPKQ